MTRGWYCQVCGATFPVEWDHSQKIDIGVLLVRIQKLKEALALYALMKPEKVYNVTGMSDDEIIESLNADPELLIKMDGGRLARAALKCSEED